MLNLMETKNTKGQALLIVLLSLAVVLTIVLFIVSRSITDISISTKEENSLRAFSAAEAGIERALIIGSDVDDTIGDANFSATLVDFAQGFSEVTYPLSLNSGESATFWFVGHNNDGSLGCLDEPCFRGTDIRFCWGNSGTSDSSSTTPAVEFSFVYTTSAGDYTTTRVARAVVDPNPARRVTNNFSSNDAGTCSLGSEDFEFQKSFNFSSDLGISDTTTANILQFVRARVLYNTSSSHKLGASVAFAGNTTLPSQGAKVESTGSFSEANRKIEVYQLHPETPSIFESVIFSSGSITK